MSSFTIKQTTVNQLPQTLLNKQDIGDYATNDSVDDKLQLNLLNYTTNRILEIPQNIKVELDDNKQLVLKAGSKIWYPDGFEADGVTPKFSSIITQDTITDLRYGVGRSGVIVVYSFNEKDHIEWSVAANFFSGTTQPTDNWYIWYDTTENRIKLHNGIDGYDTNVTFPFCIATEDSPSASGLTDGGLKSIDQVFNGFGYIGSTAFALPGVKYQFADGRNSDGTFKSITKTFDKVATTQYGYNIKDPERQPLSIHESGALIRTVRYFIQNSQPVYTDAVWYKPETNETFRSNSGVWSNSKEIIIATNIATNANFKITSFEPEIASSINIYARSDISGMTMPSGKSIHLTLGSNGTTYLAPANGWFIGNFICSKEGSWFVLEMRAKHTKSFSCAKGNNTEVCAMLPVLEGDSIILGIDSSATFTTDTTRQGFYFIYANGED